MSTIRIHVCGQDIPGLCFYTNESRGGSSSAGDVGRGPTGSSQEQDSSLVTL